MRTGQQDIFLDETVAVIGVFPSKATKQVRPSGLVKEGAGNELESGSGGETTCMTRVVGWFCPVSGCFSLVLAMLKDFSGLHSFPTRRSSDLKSVV